MAERDERRKASYNQIRSLGFTPDEARRMRDHTSYRVNQEIHEEGRRVEKVPVRRRTPVEKYKFREIRRYERWEAPFKREPSRRERLANFQRWSRRNVGFPQDAQDWITRHNIQHRKDPLDSFGYRLFYHWYVNGKPEPEARDIADRNDT